MEELLLFTQADVNKLTGMEKNILKLISSGLQNKAIAKILNICIKTVESHKENIKQKLGLNSVKDLYNLNFSRLNL